MADSEREKEQNLFQDWIPRKIRLTKTIQNTQKIIAV